MKIDEEIILELIYWARRYCDDRSTYAPTRFNWIYEHIMSIKPSLRDKDRLDTTLQGRGKYWPYAQDGMFDEETGFFDARPNEKYVRQICPYAEKNSEIDEVSN